MTPPRFAPETEEVQFTVTYDGPAVAGGRMDMRVLAPAMLSVAQLVDDAARVSFGPTAAVRVDVKADFQHGSFAFDVLTSPVQAQAAAQAIQASIDTVRHLSVAEVRLILEWLGLIGGAIALPETLISGVRWLQNRRIQAVRASDIPGNAEILTEDGDRLTVNVHIAQLIINANVRDDLYGVVAPLTLPGFTEFRAGGDRVAEVVVTSEETPLFTPPERPAEELYDRTTEELVEVLAPSFVEGNMWRVSLGGGDAIFADIADDQFRRDVENHVYTFGRGDVLRVLLRRQVQRRTGEGIKRAFTIVKMLEHIPAHDDQIDFTGFSSPG